MNATKELPELCFRDKTPLETVRETLKKYIGRHVHIVSCVGADGSYCNGRLIEEDDGSFTLLKKISRIIGTVRYNNIDLEMAIMMPVTQEGKIMHGYPAYCSVHLSEWNGP